MSSRERARMDRKVDVAAGGLTFRGCSRAGLGTAVLVRELRLLLDAGLCDLELIGCDAVLISHEHPDHFIALPQILTMRRLLGHPELLIVVPAESRDEIDAYLQAGQLASARARWDYRLQSAEGGMELKLPGGRLARPFAVRHSVVALGYVIYEPRRKLLPEFLGASPRELATRKAEGETIDVVELVPLLAVSGDTTADGLLCHPDALRARVLLTECTFIDPAQRGRARETQHTHLADLIPVLADGENEAVVLYHTSLRHRREDIEQALDAALEPALRQRVHILL